MIEIFSDFDGTLTHRDTLEFLLSRFAPPSWREIDRRMITGEITERQGLKDELALIDAPDAELLRALEEGIRPAEGLDEFIGCIRQKGWRMTVLSGGLIHFAGTLWEKWGYGDIPLFANDHHRDGRGRIEVIEAKTPRLREYCNHCKRWHVEEALKQGSCVVYIGDGLTDRCPTEIAHRRYARGHLLDYLRGKGLTVVPFGNLRQVAEDLMEKMPKDPKGFGNL